MREASERRVAPGTPIHSLKKRLKRTSESEAHKPAPAPSAAAAAAAATAAAPAGASAVLPTARAQAKAKAAAAARVPGHANGVSRSLDAARTKEASDYLKSQICEANMLLEVRIKRSNFELCSIFSSLVLYEMDRVYLYSILG